MDERSQTKYKKKHKKNRRKHKKTRPCRKPNCLKHLYDNPTAGPSWFEPTKGVPYVTIPFVPTIRLRPRMEDTPSPPPVNKPAKRMLLWDKNAQPADNSSKNSEPPRESPASPDILPLRAWYPASLEEAYMLQNMTRTSSIVSSPAPWDLLPLDMGAVKIPGPQEQANINNSQTVPTWYTDEIDLFQVQNLDKGLASDSTKPGVVPQRIFKSRIPVLIRQAGKRRVNQVGFSPNRRAHN